MPRLPLSKLDGRTWYGRFRRYVPSLFSWNGVKKTSAITETWTETMKDIHEKMGYEVRKELGNIDLMAFDREHSEAQIAIELQQNKGDLMKRDLPKLACSNAQLKVLLARIRENEIDGFKSMILGFWQKRARRVWFDDLLLLFVIERPSGANEVVFTRVEPYLSEKCHDWIKLKPRLL